ncbi:MAG: hypothetical protein NTX23_04445 [Candidatus Bipolaricaulota bacterium]|nr:hypothetical protein [Candidatus Bipolaricaulota bacterium]
MRRIGISTTSYAKSAKVAKRDRFTVASHAFGPDGRTRRTRAQEESANALDSHERTHRTLACGYGELGTTSNTASETSSDAAVERFTPYGADAAASQSNRRAVLSAIDFDVGT